MVLSLCLWAHGAWGADVLVDGSGPVSLQSAVAAAASGDRVFVRGDHPGPLLVSLPNAEDTLVIEGVFGTSSTSQGIPVLGQVVVANGTVTLRGLTLRPSASEPGLLVADGALVLGEGLLVTSDGTMTASGVSVRAGGELECADCRVIGLQSAPGAAGVETVGGAHVRFERGRFEGNVAQGVGAGAAIHMRSSSSVDDGPSLTVSGSWFCDNASPDGAVIVAEAATRVERSVFVHDDQVAATLAPESSWVDNTLRTDLEGDVLQTSTDSDERDVVVLNNLFLGGGSTTLPDMGVRSTYNIYAAFDVPPQGDGDIAVNDVDGLVLSASLDCAEFDPRLAPGSVARNAGWAKSSIDMGAYDDEVEPYGDADGDGVPLPFDCDDGSGNTFPGALEQCNGRDDDCDGAIDEEAVEVWFADGDGDGVGGAFAIACFDVDRGRWFERTASRAGAFVSGDGDCDDDDATAYLGAEEDCGVPNGDRDCDGAVAALDSDCIGTTTTGGDTATATATDPDPDPDVVSPTSPPGHRVCAVGPSAAIGWMGLGLSPLWLRRRATRPNR